MPDAMPVESNSKAPSGHLDEEAAFSHHIAVGEAYMTRFGRPVPVPAMVSFEAVTLQMEKALKRGKPISDNYNWWAYLPPGADA